MRSVPNPDTVWTTIQAALATQVDALLQRSYSELERLPACEPIGGRHNGIDITFTTYRDVLEDGAIQIIVHASTSVRRAFFFRANMLLAQGFRLSRDGRVQDVPDRDLYEFRQPAV